ncbi:MULTISPECIES: TetR/AcrR family transcriptional regulator [unclassified Treponema]|uniref:TetR/AcrR family transcriptional regulator n=1 Tax=unclassified Treponema TaxID=2638727 RepID=UPI0005300D16|nr:MULTISPECIES: TetR/AcrR family transcriptional regulator [unclassified Treponema]AIW89965.1 TetR family transcriptional regulator [Treponema sp. OMZ 838]UTC50053.1 TetR/AcrR family transcriptional regulator [Treponema sp. OMZ 855]
MPRDKTANHIKIIAAAKAEFMEMGFDKSSMRRIAERCGMTAAGIYRHCVDKADLFDQIVAPAVDRINAWLDAHVARYVDAVHHEERIQWRDSEIDMMREIIYPNMEEYHLLLAKSRGSKYEHFLHDLTEGQQAQLLQYMPMLKAQGYAVRDITPKELHLLLSAYTTALFEPVIHNYSVKEALRCLTTVEAFFVPGWKQLLGF